MQSRNARSMTSLASRSRPARPRFSTSRTTGDQLTVLTSLMILLSAFWLQGCAGSRQTTFGSADLAVQSLIAAIRADDRDQLERILGPEADSVLSSGDPVSDRNGVEDFLQAFDDKHQLVEGEEGVMTLQIGNSDWPLPIPIVRKGEKWRFDTASGLDEIFARRIGRNELRAILVCRAIVDAELEYAAMDPDGDGVQEYAQQAISDPGKKNGLFWETLPDEKPSPLGLLAAEAAQEGYAPRSSGDDPRPFHGYFFRLLKSQGRNARGGAFDYVVDGRMIGGFALVAYPAAQGNSGIMTFLVNHDGVVYENYLGPKTARTAKSMNAFDPSPDWQKVE